MAPAVEDPAVPHPRRSIHSGVSHRAADVRSTHSALHHAVGELPLRGQEELWSRIRQEVLAATGRRRTMMVIAGESGSGKTRILREIAFAADQAGCVVITNEPLDAAGPAHPELLRRLDLPQGHNLTIVICDDEDTPAWSTPRGPLLVIRTHRGSPEVHHSVASEIEIQLNIPRLDSPAVAELVGDLVPRLGVRVPPADVVALAAAVVGNPNAIVELLTGLARQRSAAAELPGCTRGRIERALGCLSVTAADLVVVASLAHRQRTVAELAARLGIGVPQAARAAQEAVDRGLLAAEGDMLVFPHQTVRALVAASCAPLAVSALRRLELDCPQETVDVPVQIVHERAEQTPTDFNRPRGPLPVEPEGVTASEEPDLGTLTEIQQRIVRLASQGLTNQAIAHRVFLSPFTVNYHLRQIFKKLGITSRIQLARLFPH